ncbi:MAG: PucR family transcriptional regulator ligand-binding domain-containing protein [Actinobacteria bacterium]|nr:PucR family transcriptional regulator ligand-binding domain-containing protein [Actinomycetota bacterium]
MWRSFDVRAVVRAIPLDDARVVAGADGLNRPVTRARLAATPEHLRRVAAGDLVVTTAAAVAATAEPWEQVVARLDAAQVAALALRLDDTATVPASLVDAADRLGLPVITFPADAALADVTSAILDALLDAQRQRLERMLEVHQRFGRIVLAGGGPAEIAAALHDLLGCTVAVVDPDGDPIVVVPSDAPDAALVRDEHGAGRVSHPIRAGDQDYGAIVALCAGRDLREDATMALERAAMAVAMRQAQAAAVAEAEERFAAISLEELISGHATGVVEIAERAASFGWDLGRPRAVLLASVDPPTEPRVLAAALATIAAAARATLGRDAIVWRRSATIAALVAPEGDDPGERRRIAEGLRHELDERLRTVTVSIGVGRRVADASELADSFVEASRAVDVGRWAKGRHVTEVFDELGLERLLSSVPQEELADFVRHAIGALHDHDRDHGAELVDTLAMWLETRNMAEAARRMHVHYNTLKNRLERVEAILGPVLDDPARALECEVAIHVARHYDVPWSDDPTV